MKRTLPFLLLISLLAPILPAGAQIVLDRSAVEQLFLTQGVQRAYNATDFDGAASIVAAAGANATYDFTSFTYVEEEIEDLEQFTFSFEPVTGDEPGAGQFAGAQLVSVFTLVEEDSGLETKVYAYFSEANDALLLLGIYGEFDDADLGSGSLATIYEPGLPVLPFVVRYQDTFSYSGTQTSTLNAAGQSFSTTSTLMLNIEVDGYGTLITPVGTADALRVRSETTITDDFGTFTGTDYQFLTNENFYAEIYTEGDEIFGVTYYVLGDVDNTAAEPVDGAVPDGFALQTNYPNPFNPQTTIPFGVAATAPVTLAVYDAQGRHVTTLVDETLAPGTYQAAWSGAGLPSGVYFARLQAGAHVEMRAMTLVR